MVVKICSSFYLLIKKVFFLHKYSSINSISAAWSHSDAKCDQMETFHLKMRAYGIQLKQHSPLACKQQESDLEGAAEVHGSGGKICWHHWEHWESQTKSLFKSWLQTNQWRKFLQSTDPSGLCVKPCTFFYSCVLLLGTKKVFKVDSWGLIKS